MAAIADFIRSHGCIGIDTSIFIYHYEKVAEYLPATSVIFEEVAAGSSTAVTSVITVTELNAHPLSLGRRDLVSLYTEVMLQFPHLALREIDLDTAQLAAELRARHNLRTADALQIAACLKGGATGFITNDRRLSRVRELDVLVLGDTDDIQGQA